jgi:ABC-2 type transport system ATP-binding protein
MAAAQMSPGSTVSLTRATKRFKSRDAVDGLSLFAQGGVTTLLGPNGAGKTTLLRGLATVHGFDDGIVQIDGLNPSNPRERTEIRRRVGYLPQDPAFSPHATSFDVVDYLAVLKGMHDRRPRHREVRRVLNEAQLIDRSSSKVKELSGGMRRRLGLAQALLGTPGLVLLDEPAAGLDPQQRLMLRDRISRLGTRCTVIQSTHLTEEAAAVSQMVHVMSEGRFVYSGPPAELAEMARGRVWLADESPPSSAHLAWRTADGRWRAVGAAPAGAELDEPTLEDAYLLLVGRGGLDAAA